MSGVRSLRIGNQYHSQTPFYGVQSNRTDNNNYYTPTQESIHKLPKHGHVHRKEKPQGIVEEDSLICCPFSCGQCHRPQVFV